MIKNGQLKSRNLSEEKKQPEHKYYVKFVTKVEKNNNSIQFNFIVPTLDTKVTEYLCSGWVFFSSDKFRLYN